MWRESIKEREQRYRKILTQVPELLAEPESPKGELAATLAETNNTNQVCSMIAAYVTGPALYVFVDWVIRSAVKAGQKRLYFLARDGYLMYLAAQIYCKVNDINIDCRYLYCSRYALRIPMYHLNRKDAMEYICRNGIHVTPERILRRSGLDTDLCRRLAIEYFPEWEPDRALNRRELASLQARLSVNDGFWELCASHSKEVCPEVEKYFVKEGLMDEVPYALVDSGWIGSMQKTLGQLLAQIQAGQIPGLTGYYWGLYDLPQDADPADYRAYFFAPWTGEKEKCAFNNNLFEVLFSAPHGMTIGYLDGEPVLGETQNEQVELIRQMEPYLVAYVRQVSERAVDIEATRCRKVIRQLFDVFMCHPIKEEAYHFGEIPFSDDIFVEAEQRLAKPVSEQALQSSYPARKIMHAAGITGRKEIVLPWYEASAVLSKTNTARHLRAYQTYKKLLTQRQERNWRKQHG